MSKFVLSDLMKQDAEEQYNDAMQRGSSVKAVAIQTNPTMKVTTPFRKSKMLMFAKT